jgi:pimeloyl-ACP methyl ester carboxylesterase
VGRVQRVLDAIRALPMPVARREDAVAHFTALGFSQRLAGWMTTNLRPSDDGLVWRFALDPIGALLDDYRALDLWPFVHEAAQEVRILRAGRSDRWSAADAARATDVLEDAGHWVHIDDPDGLAAALAPTFESEAA